MTSHVASPPPSFRRPAARLAGLVLGLAVMAAAAEARSARALVRLSCPPGTEALCRDLTQVLAQAAEGSVIRRVAPGDEPPTRPGDLGLALVQGAGGLRLLWQRATDAAPQPTPILHPQGDPARDAAALLAASPDLRRALAALRPASP